MNARTARPMPARLGRYEVRAKIGEGGMATVFLGHDRGEARGAERVVALKVIKDEFALNPEFVSMFLDESKIVSRLDHPNVIHVYELGNEGARLFIAMELLFGQSLWHVWNACRSRGLRLRYDIAAWIGARVAEGLHHAHELRAPDGTPVNLVHRDVNASNIFVTYSGEVKIIDFGLATAIGRVSKTQAGVVKGKLAYMSPEQTVGKPLDRRSDVFALGTTLWEITVDQRLFKGTDDMDTLRRVHAGEVPDPSALVEGYPPGLWAPIKRALAREPEARHATAAELARELDAFARASGHPVDASVVAEVMQSLFKDERKRQATWIEDASAADRPAPRDALVSIAAPRFGASMAPPSTQPDPALAGGLFAGPAIETQRDPVLAAQQEATAQGGISARPARAPAPPASPARAPVEIIAPRTPTASGSSALPAGVPPTSPAALATVFALVTLIALVAALAVVLWWTHR